MALIFKQNHQFPNLDFGYARPDEAVAVSTGKLELIIKINELPNNVETNKDNWKTFELDCDGRVVSVTVKPKIWKKLEDAVANYPQWVAAIGGKMGESTPNGFVLSEPSIQVFEKKPKEPKPEAEQ